MLPAGRKLNSPMERPAKNFNRGITLIDYMMVQDPESEPSS
jgi:hypothetical protein